MKNNNLNKFQSINNNELKKVNGGFNHLAHTMGEVVKVGIVVLPFFL